MALHDQLRNLVEQHGPSILDVAEDFRAALDDFLGEDEATTGEINLLVDAVRLGSLRRMVEMLDQGADPEPALDEAATQLARDRDTDPERARWALGVLGYALGRVEAPADGRTASAGERRRDPDTEQRTSTAEASPETVPSPAPASGAPTSANARARRWWVPLLAAAAVLVVIGGAFVLWPDDDKDDGGGDRQSADPSASAGADAESCPEPATPLVDDEADDAARCLAGRLDEWTANGLMLVGQQVNLADDEWEQPLIQLEPQRVGLVGFDFSELFSAGEFGADRMPDLVRVGQDVGALTATWHADNPWSGQPSWDPTDNQQFGELLDPDADDPAVRAFWEAWDEVVAALVELGEAGVPVIMRPLHEANGNWFWWGHQDPAVMTQLFGLMRERATAAGVHNVLWSFAAAPRTYDGIQDPVELLPEVDLVGLDTYDCEQPGTRDERLECGGGNKFDDDQVDLTSFAELAAVAPRMSLSEVGPQFSYDGSWNPTVVTTTVVAEGFSPAYAMFWFDDRRAGRPPMSKQIATLLGGPEWLASCPDALCDVSRP